MRTETQTDNDLRRRATADIQQVIISVGRIFPVAIILGLYILAWFSMPEFTASFTIGMGLGLTGLGIYKLAVWFRIRQLKRQERKTERDKYCCDYHYVRAGGKYDQCHRRGDNGNGGFVWVPIVDEETWIPKTMKPVPEVRAFAIDPPKPGSWMEPENKIAVELERKKDGSQFFQ